MNLSVCWIPLATKAVAVTMIVFVCGCQPAAEVGKSIDASASPPAIGSPAPGNEDGSFQAKMNEDDVTSKEGAKKTEQGLGVAAEEDAAEKNLADVESAADAATEKMFKATFFCWNVESEGSDPKVIAKQLAELGPYDVYAITEFLPSAKGLFEETLGEHFELIMSRSGRNDRLAIAFDTRLFDLIKSFEIKEINYKNRYRSPLVAHLKDKNSGVEFFVMNNHLARGKEEVRLIQTKQLVAWARTQLLPVVALGDYNLDYVFATGKGNSGFASMLYDNVWKWIKPVELIDTNWYDNPEEPDGKDDYPGSMLDFAFVSGPAKKWNATCKIIVRPDDFPDDQKTSDHRPFELLISN